MRIHGLKKVKYHRSAIITKRRHITANTADSDSSRLERAEPAPTRTPTGNSTAGARTVHRQRDVTTHVTSQDTARVSRHAQSRHTTDHTMSSCFIYTRPSPHPSAPAPTPAAALRCPVGTAPSCSQLPGLRTRCEADMLASTANAIARAAGVRTQASSAAGAEVRGASA